MCRRNNQNVRERFESIGTVASDNENTHDPVDEPIWITVMLRRDSKTRFRRKRTWYKNESEFDD